MILMFYNKFNVDVRPQCLDLMLLTVTLSDFREHVCMLRYHDTLEGTLLKIQMSQNKWVVLL